MDRLDLPVAEIVRRYKKGESACSLASVYGVSGSTVRRRLVEAKTEMRPAWRPGGWRKSRHMCQADGSGYLGTFDRDGRKCYIHRACWEAYHGPIPGGNVVHHENEDLTDNRIKNLAAMTVSDHLRLHRRREAIERERAK